MSRKVDPVRPPRPKVSVIMPTYNRADLLPAAIDSVLGQSFTDFEVLVIDDGSEDATRQVVAGFSDPRIHYCHQRNSGVSAARNRGLEIARGEYLAFLDSDDLFLPAKLAFQVAQLDENPTLGMVAGGFRYIDWQGAWLAERRPWVFQPTLDLSTVLLGAAIITNSVLLRKEWIERLGGFNPTFSWAEDLDLWLRMAVAGCQISWSQAVVCAYRMHADQAVRDVGKQSRGTLQVFEALYERSDLPEQALRLRSRAEAAARVSVGGREYGGGQFEAGRALLSEALRLDPSLAQGENPPLLFTLIAWAAEPVTGDPAAFTRALMEHLPEGLDWEQRFGAHFMRSACIAASLDALWLNRPDLAAEYLSNAVKIQLSAWQDAEKAVVVLIDALQAYEPDARPALLERWFEVLPPQLAAYQSRCNKAAGRLFMARGFKAQQRGHLAEAAAAFRQGVRCDPSWLLNRGVLSVLARDAFNTNRKSK